MCGGVECEDVGDGGGEESMGEQGMCEGVRVWRCGECEGAGSV